MKLLLALALVLVSLSVTYGKLCEKAEDCDEDRCCVALTMSSMKKKGICLKLNRLGTRCSEWEAKQDYYGGKFMHFCPCQEGMTCKPKGLRPGVTDMPSKLSKMRCQKEDKTSPSVEKESKMTSPSVEKESKMTSPSVEKDTKKPEEILETTKEEVVVEITSTETPTSTEVEPKIDDDREPEPDEEPEPEPDTE